MARTVVWRLISSGWDKTSDGDKARGVLGIEVAEANRPWETSLLLSGTTTT